MDVGFAEMLLIGIVLVLFFGPKKLPELGSSIGRAIKHFKHTLRDTTQPSPQHSAAKDRQTEKTETVTCKPGDQ
jgi:sec-independent protein translocase protein TatA